MDSGLGGIVRARRGRPPKVRPETVSPPVEKREPVPVRRFLADDIDAWFAMRLDDRWPGYSLQTWRGKFKGFAESNEFLCIANGSAVALMYTGRHIMTGRPIVYESLMWSRDAKQNTLGDWVVDDRSPEKYPILELYDYARTWAKQMGAARMIVGACSDLVPSALREFLGGQYMVDLT